MRKVKHQFHIQSTDACLSRSKAIIYNEAMSEKNPTEGLIARLTALNAKGIKQRCPELLVSVSRQSQAGSKQAVSAKSLH